MQSITIIGARIIALHAQNDIVGIFSTPPSVSTQSPVLDFTAVLSLGDEKMKSEYAMTRVGGNLRDSR